MTLPRFPKATLGEEIMNEIHDLELKGYGIGSRIHKLLEEKINGKFIIDQEFVARLESLKKIKDTRSIAWSYFAFGWNEALDKVLEAFR